MKDSKGKEMIRGSHLPHLINIFLEFANNLPDDIEPKAAAVREFRNGLVHDTVFARDPDDIEEFLTLTDQYIEKIGHVRYVMHIGADWKRWTRAHEHAHTPFTWPPEAQSTDQPKPPAGAEFLLRMLLSGNDVDAITGDLAESYVKRRARYGDRRAKLWFYGQVILSIWPLLKRFISRRRLRHPAP
jgi:hypothetical protein